MRSFVLFVAAVVVMTVATGGNAFADITPPSRTVTFTDGMILTASDLSSQLDIAINWIRNTLMNGSTYLYVGSGDSILVLGTGNFATLRVATTFDLAANITPRSDGAFDIGRSSARVDSIYANVVNATRQSRIDSLSTSVVIDGDIDFLGAQEISTSSGALTLNPATDILVADGKGAVVGNTAQVTMGGALYEFQVVGTGAVDAGLAVGRWSNNDTAPAIVAYKSKSTAIGSFAAVASGTELLRIRTYGDDGTDDATEAAYIAALVDGSVGTGDVPTAWVFATADGGTATEAMRITSDRKLLVGLTDGSNSTSLVQSSMPSSNNIGFAAMDGTATLFEVSNSAGGSGRVILRSAATTTFSVDGATSKMLLGSGASSSNLTSGAVFDQGSNDDNIFELASSDVSQPATSVNAARTFFSIKKVGADDGGAFIRGHNDASSTDGKNALILSGISGDALVDSTDNSSSGAVVHFRVEQTDGGTSTTGISDAENGFVWTNFGITKMLLKGGGVLHLTNATPSALDYEDDRGLIRALERERGAGVIMSRWDSLVTSTKDDLIRAGVLGSDGTMLKVQPYLSLLGGGIWQNATDIMDARSDLGGRIAALETENAILRSQFASLRSEFRSYASFRVASLDVSRKE